MLEMKSNEVGQRAEVHRFQWLKIICEKISFYSILKYVCVYCTFFYCQVFIMISDVMQLILKSTSLSDNIIFSSSEFSPQCNDDTNWSAGAFLWSVCDSFYTGTQGTGVTVLCHTRHCDGIAMHLCYYRCVCRHSGMWWSPREELQNSRHLASIQSD